MPIRTLSLAVVGAQYPNKRGGSRIFEIKICTPGEPIDLVPEPKNPADEHAIAVHSVRGIQIGYLTAERAPWIGSILKAGREVRAIFQGEMTNGAIIRVAFDGEAPVLSTPAESRRGPEEEPFREPDFYPDEIYPDD